MLSIPGAGRDGRDRPVSPILQAPAHQRFNPLLADVCMEPHTAAAVHGAGETGRPSSGEVTAIAKLKQ